MKRGARISRGVLPASLVLAGIAVSCIPLGARAEVAADIYWQNPFSTESPNQYTDAIVVRGDAVYFGGSFRQAGGVDVNRIARWSRGEWSSVGSGVGTPTMGLVHTMLASGGSLYAGGMFDQIGIWRANNVAVYDIEADRWLPLGGGTDRAVRNVIVGPGGDIFVVGEFTTADGRPAPGVARWDGGAWHDLGGSLYHPRGARALALATDGTRVYVGGYFTRAGGVDASNIAVWDGTAFAPLGSGANNLVTVITVAGTDVYAGGAFDNAGGVVAHSIARWDGSRWHALGDGLEAAGMVTLRAIYVDVDQVYVGGTHTYVDGRLTNYISTWVDGGWETLGSGMNDQVKTIVPYRGDLLVGGNFSTAGGKDSPYVALWTQPGRNTIEFRSFAAKARARGVDVTWETVAYGPVSGYNVYRRVSGTQETIRINDDIVAPDQDRLADDTAEPGRTYEYTLGVVRGNGTEALSAPVTVAWPIPTFALQQNAPNPFNPATTIRFTLPQSWRVRVAVYRANGELVRLLEDGVRPAGTSEVFWDGRDDGGRSVASGVYFYRMNSGGQSITRKMVLLK